MIARTARLEEVNRGRQESVTVSISLAEDIKTVEELVSDPRALLALAQRNGRPVVIAEGGKPTVVMLKAERYEWLVHLVKLARLLNESEESIRKHGTITLEEFEREVEKKYGYALSPRTKPARKGRQRSNSR
jgi:PHD/YefM family antitoxin component YafN of YafNO toxin-antitoxin module